MKKWNKILMSAALVLTLAMFAGCGRNDNAADETRREESKAKEKDTEIQQTALFRTQAWKMTEHRTEQWTII